MSEIDLYGYQCLGIVTCPSTFPIMAANDTAHDVILYRLDENLHPDSRYFQGKKGDILLGGGPGEAPAFRIAIPEALYWWTHEDWDEAEHWSDICHAFWTATQAYVFCEGYSKLGWSPPEPIEFWLTQHVLSFLVKHYPGDYGQYLGSKPLEYDGSICRLPDGIDQYFLRPPKYGRLPMSNPEFRIIFCEDPLERGQPDSMYEAEVTAVLELGISFDLINFEAIVNMDDTVQAVRAVAAQEQPTLAVYRGWMLKPDQYARLWEELALKQVYLINTARAYKNAHYLPESYRAIEQVTPKTVWTTDISIDAIMSLLEPFGDKPLILKDYVKSQKHYWMEACYIPSAFDREAVERVVKRFLELQGDDLNEGLVFREYIEFESIGGHSRSGMPITNEFRIFWLDGEPVYISEYWEEGDYQQLKPPIEQFRPVAQIIHSQGYPGTSSQFFTMDVAKSRNGDWMIVELGDAQVAGLPEKANVLDFYTALKSTLSKSLPPKAQ